MNRSAVLLVGLLAACADASGSGTTIEMLPSGIELVTNRGSGAWSPGVAWRLEPQIRVGSADGAPTTQFTRIADVALDLDGNIYVLETRPPEVRVFDSQGRYLRTIGRSGEGPGEFGTPYALTFDSSNRLWVGDSRNARYSVFERDGAFVKAFPSPIRGGGQLRIEDSRLYDFEALALRERGLDGSLRMQSLGPGMIALDIGEGLVPTDTILFGAVQMPGLVQEREGSRSTIVPAFATQRFYEAVGGGHAWVGTSDQYLIHELSLAADTVRTVVRDAEPVSIAADDMADLEAWFESFSARGFAGDRSVLPRTYPRFVRIIASEDGTIWLQREDPRPAFDVFDREGRLLGTVLREDGVRSAGVHPFINSTQFVTVGADSLGVQRVLVYRILKGDG